MTFVGNSVVTAFFDPPASRRHQHFLELSSVNNIFIKVNSKILSLKDVTTPKILEGNDAEGNETLGTSIPKAIFTGKLSSR